MTTTTASPHRHYDIQPRPGATGPPIRQLSARQVLAVWAAATAPMAVAAWVIAPRLATKLGDQGLGKALVLTLTAGMIWQFVLTAVLIAGEQHTLRWSIVGDALWLRAPQSPKTGRRGGKLWFVILPLAVGFAAEGLIPGIPHPGNRDLGTILDSPGGQAWFQGAWGWFAIALVMFVFNTVLGEELLFRGYLLPRMTGTFGRWAWLANGLAFATYHLHVPWVIPATLSDAFVIAYPSQRYSSAWIGIIVHSLQSVFFAVALLALVLR